MGQKDLQRRRYLQAVESFQRVVNTFPGYARVADAQYYLAEAYFGMEEYVSAVFEYQRLVDTYPSSPWRDRAQFMIGESYFEQSRRAELDQKETRDALAAYRTFIEENPDSPLAEKAQDRIAAGRERLARKEFLAARLYHRQGHLEAARLVYEQLLQDYPDTGWYWHGLAELGQVARAEGSLDEARRRWAEVLEGCPEEDLLEEVRDWLARLEPGAR
jgi:outer membrane protein assembly factor BamD